MTNARENSRYGHVFRPGPFHRVRAYWVDGAVLHWRVGSEAGHCRISDIVRLEQRGDSQSWTLAESNGRVHRLSDVYWYRWIAAERHRWGRYERRPHTLLNLVRLLRHRLSR